MDVPLFFKLFIHRGMSACLQFWAIMNKTAINVPVQILV